MVKAKNSLVLKSIFSVLFVTFSLSVLSQITPGIFIEDWKAKVYNHQDGLFKLQTENPTEVYVFIDANDTINKISKYMFGGNLNPYSYLFKKLPEYLGDLKNMSPNVLRWPGGNLSNDYFWNAKTSDDLPKDLPGTKYWLGSNPSTHDATTPDYYETLKATNSVGCICVNYSYARYGTSNESVQNAAHIAAEWVRHDKGRTPFWEIGNENFGNWQSGYEINPALYSDGRPRFISGNIYGAHCNVFIDSMRAAAAEVGTKIYIGIQAWEDYTSWDPIQTAWNDGVFSQVRNRADFVIIHNYFTPYKDDSDISTIFSTPGKIKHMVQVINSMYNKYSLKQMPIALTEYNIQSRESGQLISFINGMHAVMVIGEGMKNGLGMAQRWSTVGYWSAPGEMGTFSFKGEPDVPEGNMRPEFYYYYFMQKTFGDVMIQSSSSNTNIVSYASRFSSGEYGVALLNKSNKPKTTTLKLSNFMLGSNYHQFILVGGNDNSDFSGNVFVNGYGSEYIKGGPSKGYERIKPYTSSISGDIVVDIPAYGTVFLVIDGEKRPKFDYAKVEGDASKIKLVLSEPVKETLSVNGFSVFVNDNVEMPVVSIQNNLNTITLKLNSDLKAYDKISLSYYNGDVTTSDNRDLVFFEKEQVINLLAGSKAVVTMAKAVDKNSIITSFSKMLKNENLSDIEIFKENFEDEKLSLINVMISPEDKFSVIFETESDLQPSDRLLIKYDKNTVMAIDGGLLEPFTMDVNNELEPIEPHLDSAILYDNGIKLVLYYNQLMAGTDDEEINFTFKSNNRIVGIASVSTSQNKIIIFFNDKPGVGEQLILNYSGGFLKSEQGIFASDIVDFEILNNLIYIPEPKFFYDVKVQGVASSFELDILNNGKRIFTDRDYSFTNVPENLINSEFIRVPNGLKSANSSVLYSFKVNAKGKLYIAHDDRISKPDWLISDFVITNKTLNISGTNSTLYYKNVQKDILVRLGANQIPGTETSGCNNYVIIFESDKNTTRNSNAFIEKDITVFPNPADNEISLVAENYPINMIRIKRIDGALIKEIVFNGLSQVTFPVNDLSVGIHFLEIYGPDSKVVKKIVINR